MSERLSRAREYVLKSHLTDWVQALSAILIVVITSYYTKAARDQAELLRQSVQEITAQSKDIRRSADATETAAKAAITNADAAVAASKAAQIANDLTGQGVRQNLEATRRDQRAWITVLNFKLYREVADNERIKVKVSIMNTGKTPALHLNKLTGLLFAGAVPTVNLKGLHGENSGIVFPGASGVSFDSGSFLVPTGMTAAYQAKNVRVYIRSLINYRDVFGLSHWTEVCAFHESGMDLTEFNFCGTGNDIDK